VLQGVKHVTLDDRPVAAGCYEWIRLQVNAAFDDVHDSYIELDDGSQHELRIPSGSQSGLKLTRGFTVGAGGETALTVDFDLRTSVIDPRGQPGYFLKPVLRLVNDLAVGKIRGSVDSAFA
jgi:hypothetical protein